MNFNRRGLFKSGIAGLFTGTVSSKPISPVASPIATPTLVPGVGVVQIIDPVQKLVYFKDLEGMSKWMKDGILHREDGPAIEEADGRKEWYLNGQLHREDGPAIECANGRKEWYLNGQRHREDGPAIEHYDGGKEWYQNSKLHREDGPAVEYADGTKEWYQNDNRHRIDGPACEYANGNRKWWVNGKRHRIDGPAVEYVDGTKEWYLDGRQVGESEFHRLVARYTKPKPRLLGIQVAARSLSDPRVQRLALGLTLRTFCKLNGLDPVERRQLERSTLSLPTPINTRELL
jgi:hypothetical protein